jgi:formylglycine-generating enzyme required for sulfatase activity
LKIEGSRDLGVDVQYRWEDSSRRFHSHSLHIDFFYIDKYPITNVEFKKFMDAAHYHPKDNLNFLRDWEPFGGVGKQAGDVGFPRRCAVLCELGGKASAA